MAWRYRAHLRFQPNSGMAQWCHDQMLVRMGMAFHMREGHPNQESSYNIVDGDDYHLDVFWPDDQEQLAIDTRNTFSDASVLAWVKPDEGTDLISWQDYHFCRQDGEPEPVTDETLGAEILNCDPVSWEWSQ